MAMFRRDSKIYMIRNIIKLTRFIPLILALFFTIPTHAQNIDALKTLEKAYPDYIDEITSQYIAWKDGTRMQVKGSFALFDKISAMVNKVDPKVGSISNKDVLEDDYEPFFRKMYGSTAKEVKHDLVTLYWMPKVFGNRYSIRVTTKNGVDKKLRKVMAELEKLPPEYHKYLANPAGGFYWRNVKGQSYLSAHSFGIAIDINSHYGNYWLWDVKKYKCGVSKLPNHNHIPMRIVKIFEDQGFYWGGHWHFYDTMHFEYRPELFLQNQHMQA